MPLVAIANAELNAEIDPEADEQHRERDRDQVERADQIEPERRRDRQADEEIDQDREDHAAAIERQPQDDEDDRDGDDAVDRGALLHRAEFLVRRSGPDRSGAPAPDSAGRSSLAAAASEWRRSRAGPAAARCSRAPG